MTSQQPHEQWELAQLQLTPELQKHELDRLLAAQPAPARGRYELLLEIQGETYGDASLHFSLPLTSQAPEFNKAEKLRKEAEDVKKLMAIMDEARTNLFPRGHQNLRKSRQPYELVLRLIASIEDAPALPHSMRSAYLELTDSRCYRQSLYKLLQVLRESEASGDYGNAKLFVPFLQILATDFLNVESSDDGHNELQ